MTIEVLIVAVAALAIAAAAVPACIAVAHRFAVIDNPGPLKTHEAPVPYLGGLAVFAGVVVGASVGRPVVLVPLAVALAVGVSDDRFGLSPRLRILAQLATGAIIAATQPVHLPGWIGVPLVMATSVVLINGFNLLDGLDMLSAGVGGAAAVGFAVVLHGPARLMAASLTGALIAFLWYNRPPARIYLGDGGSYLLGASMTVLLAYAWGPGVASSTGVVALALVAVPVAEVVCAVVRRRHSRRSLLSGDRSHPYDLLVGRGWSRVSASLLYIGAEVMLAVVVSVVVALDSASMVVALGIDVAAAAALIAGAALVGGLGDSARSGQ